jgi:glycosyltransferase involved in cell wall biosynthesis
MPPETVRFAVIVPAYRPEQALLDLIAALTEKSIPAIVVVDDGSGAEYRDIFDRAAEFPQVWLVRHAVNLGKGAALKSGFNCALCAFPDLQGVITADADGQHQAADIESVAEALAAQPDRVILGTRTFGGDIPLRSKAGNVITRTVMRALVGQSVSDTQTGLRGIPTSLLPHLLRTQANGYDFELDMLIAVRQQAIQIEEVPIRTIYEPGNRTSHFNPLLDSMKIYFVLLRFSWVGLMSAALDTVVFYLVYRKLSNLAASQALGRVLAVAFNYTMVRRTVFFSKLRHASVLPKYLLLVCLSGTAAYAGIQFLNSHFHTPPMLAKVLVESLLFFANFAIQRDFIFGRSADAPRKKRASLISKLPRWIPPAVLAAVAIALVAVVLHGFRAGFLNLDGGWSPIGWRRFLHYAWIFWAASLAMLLAVPRVYPAVVAVLITVATGAALGPWALLAVAGFLISSCALGSRILRARDDTSLETQLCATLLGIAANIFLMTFLVRLPVNYPAVYVLLLAIPVLADLRGTERRLAASIRALRIGKQVSRTQMLSFALLVFMLGTHWLIVPQPESSADGLAMHLAIPVNISLHHMLTYRPDRILWSVMPMGADWCYSMVYLPGGEYAARLLNFAMLLLLEALLYRAVRRWVTPAVAFLILALFASTSAVQMVTGSMFIENFLAAMVVGMVLAIWRFGETGQGRFLYAAAALGGTALAIKLGGFAYVIAALPLVVIEVRRQWRRMGSRPALACAIALLLLLAAALPAYTISWRLTGDPVFPFLNQKFPSPILDRSAVLSDYRFHESLSLRTPFDLTFHSDRYYEGRAGSLGFQGLLLVPLGLLALLAVNSRRAWYAATVSVAGAVMVLEFLPNARYLYPSLPLMLIPLAALFGWLPTGTLRRALIVLAVASVGLNAWFLPSSNFYHGDFYERSPLSIAMRQAYIHKYAPMREIGQYMNRVHPGAPIFLTNSSELAAFNAEVYANGWHQYGIYARLLRARNAQEILDLFKQWNVHYVAAPKPNAGVLIKPRSLRDLLDHCSTPEYQAGWLYLVHLNDQCGDNLSGRIPLLAQPGQYDDFDPAILFRGPWIQDTGWPLASAQTLTYSNLPGSEVRFAFEGDLLLYSYTKAPNRGLADISIDGAHKAIVDLYSDKTEWQKSTFFDKLGRGRHLAVITVLPGKNPKSSDRYVDVDSFLVR